MVLLLPVVVECISNSLADELAVLLQCVQSVLHSLIYGLLYGATRLLDLIDTSTGLWTKKDKMLQRQSDSISKKIFLKNYTIQLQHHH